MPREQLYLQDIVEAAGAIKRFLKGIQRADFLQDELRQSAVLQKLMVIGEAAARLPVELRDRHPTIEWRDIIGFRNIAVHAYFSVDWSIVWVTAMKDAPQLQRQVTAILNEEFGGYKPKNEEE